MRRCQPSLEISHSREIEQRLGQGLQLRQRQLADLRLLLRAELTAAATKHQQGELHLALLAAFLAPFLAPLTEDFAEGCALAEILEGDAANGADLR